MKKLILLIILVSYMVITAALYLQEKAYNQQLLEWIENLDTDWGVSVRPGLFDLGVLEDGTPLTADNIREYYQGDN
ncbi:MAG: hypothetical protein KAR06_02900 [Deltaproteobacteria bacterium]|nr:hypothetical protein [Deltaproteobacteria bacterium]